MRVTKLPPVEREVPGEQGNFFSFRRLSAEEMEEAQAGTVKELLGRYGPQAMEMLTKMAPPQVTREQIETLAEMMRVDATPEQINEMLLKMTRPQAIPGQSEDRPDPLQGYSEAILVKYGLVGWRGPDYSPEDLSDEAKRELDKNTRHWAAGVVIEISEITVGEEQNSGPGSVTSKAEMSRSDSAPNGSPS